MPSKLTFLHNKFHVNFTSTKTQCKANLMENGDFPRPESATYLASNHVKLGMQHFYPFNCYMKRLKIELVVQHKMGAEHIQLNSYEQ